jgi:energy-coupling factor transport system permease protein
MRGFGRIRLGRFYPLDSPLHRLDAAVKTTCALLLTAAVFLAGSPYAVLAFLPLGAALVFLAAVPPWQALRGLKTIMVILLITSLTQLFFAHGRTLFRLGPFRVTNAGVVNGFVYSLRIIFLALVIILLTMTTSPTDLVRAFERLMRPLRRLRFPVQRLALVMTLAFRFLPVMLGRAEDIVVAQLSRGARLDSRNPLRRLRALFPLVMPFFAACFRDAEAVSLALACRGWNGEEGRTSYRIYRVGGADICALAVALAALVLGIIF